MKVIGRDGYWSVEAAVDIALAAIAPATSKAERKPSIFVSSLGILDLARDLSKTGNGRAKFQNATRCKSDL
jgi:hypothetical protein